MDSITSTRSSFIKEKKKFCKNGTVTEKNTLYSSYREDSTASRLSTPKQFLVLIWSTPERWKAESTLELGTEDPNAYIYKYIYAMGSSVPSSKVDSAFHLSSFTYIYIYINIYIYMCVYIYLHITYKGSLGKGKVTKYWNNRTVQNMWKTELSGLWLYVQYRHFSRHLTVLFLKRSLTY